MNNVNTAVISLLVENNANMLSRVTMLFGRRGFNIDSLTVSATNDPDISRITIKTTGDERIIDQIVLQTKKLVEVKAVQLMDDREAIQRELLLVKIAAKEKQRGAIREICEIYKASIVDFFPDQHCLRGHRQALEDQRLSRRRRGVRHSGAVPHRRHGDGPRQRDPRVRKQGDAPLLNCFPSAQAL